MSTSVRIGLVGCGGIARTHLEAYAALYAKGCRHFTITALFDPVPGLMAEFADKIAVFQGTPPLQFATLDELLAAQVVDGVDVCTPHADHHPTTIRCLEAGIHVLVEKPMGVTVRAARLMQQAAERTGKILSVAQNSRRGLGQRAITWLFNQDKRIGAPRMFVIEYVTGPKLPIEPAPAPTPVDRVNWRYDKLVAGGGWTYDGGVHLMDSLAVYFGPVETVYAEQRAWNPPTTLLTDGRTVVSEREDVSIATFRFANGMMGTWIFGFSLAGADFCRVAFYGERGYVLDQTAGGWTHTFGGGFIPSQATVFLPDGSKLASRDLEMEYLLSLSEERRERLFPHGVISSVAQECHEFVDCIRLGRQPEVGPREALRALATAAALYESALSGQAVKVDDVLNSRIDAFQRPVDEHWGLL